jgi:hypothetical protein
MTSSRTQDATWQAMRSPNYSGDIDGGATNRAPRHGRTCATRSLGGKVVVPSSVTMLRNEMAAGRSLCKRARNKVRSGVNAAIAAAF